MTRAIRSRPLVGTALASALLLAACGSADTNSARDDTPDAADAGPSDHHEESADDVREVSAPEPRLVAATETGALVVDLATGDTVTTVETEQRPRLSVADDERHVLLNQPDPGLTQILDAGSWSAAHGDHAHHFVAEPRLLETTIEGPNPVHVVSNGGRTAVFHDDAGTATMFDEAGLLIDSIETTTVSSAAPHHGVVVPMPDGALVSIVESDALPHGVARINDDGTEIAQFDECPGLHGEAMTSDTAAFACEDGVMLVHGDHAHTLPYPDESGERIGELATGPGNGPDDEHEQHSAGILVGDYGPQSLALVDPDASEVRMMPLEDTYGPYALTASNGVIVLTSDGTLRVLDSASGAETGAVPVVDPFELPDGHGGITPSLIVVGHTAYVADPASSTIVPVNLEELTVDAPITTDAAPTGLVAVGTGASSTHSGH